MGLPSRSEFQQFAWGWQLFPAVSQGKAFAHAVICYRQNVGASERKDQEHFNGPGPDAADAGEALVDFRVAHCAKRLAGGDDAGDRFFGDIFDCGGFGAGESGAAQPLVGRSEQLFRCGKSLAGIEGFDAAKDGLRGGSVELLMGYGADEGFEESATLSGLQGAGANLPNEPREDLVRAA